ncbi:MAG: family 10 glycosylhydrolase, partial [Chloroflexi bacterium]|nr:family 10 glycosylhydrolase [Chloroflexota bacterium]
RRANVNTLVREFATAIKQTKNYVKFGISPFGIWRNRSTDPTGSDTSGFQAYDGIYADARTWIRQGWIDYIAPQIYWSFGHTPAAYEKLVSWWTNEVRGYRVKLYIGHAAYKIGNDTAAWNNPDELPNQLAYNLQFPETMGSMLYNIDSVIANPLGLRDRLTNDSWRYPALVDPYPWLDSSPPTAPNAVAATRSASGVRIDWTSTAGDDTAFAVYRFGQGEPINLADPVKIVVVQRATTATTQSYLDTRAATGTAYTYVVTALDRLHNESAASNAVSVPAR